jgi:RNA polymerase sigma-70 factor (ECF subfamily)
MESGGLSEKWRTSRDAWPGVVVAEDEFVAYLEAHAHRSGTGGKMAAEFASDLHWADLYLACACARGDAVALAAFERAFFPDIDAAVAKLGTGAPPCDEVRQRLRLKLFVAERGTLPKIAEYSGRGELRTWVRITATRTALNVGARMSRELPFDGDALAFVIGGGEDPELVYLKRHYAEEFRAAFRDAFDGLERKERNLLRYAFGEGLTVDAIGGLYGVHRATAARWVTKAHTELASRVRTAFVGRLKIKRADYSSILRLIQSRLDITLGDYLKDGPARERRES